MIDPKNQHRFVGDSGQDIASHPVDVKFPNGERRRIILRLGAPFQKDDGQWWIRTELENLDSTVGPIAGEGPLQTLVLGIRWMILRMEVFERRRGCQFFWEDSDARFDFRGFLGTYQTAEAEPGEGGNSE